MLNVKSFVLHEVNSSKKKFELRHHNVLINVM